MTVKVKNLVEEIIAKSYNRLTKSEKKIAEYILKNLEEAAFLTSTRLAQKATVSEATVLRFSMKLGYSGFPPLQDVLQNCIKERLKPSEKLKKYVELKRENNIPSEIFGSIIGNLKETWDNIPADTLDLITDKIVGANRIYIVGFRRSFSVAYVLYYNLMGLSMDAVLVESSYGLLFDQVVRMGKKDVCICISFPRYATLTYEIIKHAKKVGCTTVVITDSLISPVAQIADHALAAKYEMSSYFDSNIIAMAIADCLVAGIAKKRRTSIKFLTNYEKALQDLNTWLISG
jgi:DNA-binding MurR/RpiR family transcriptional regulator